MDIKIENNQVLHIMQGKGWYIDGNDKMNISILKKSLIQRKSSDSDIVNNPCIYVMSACNGKCMYCYQNDHLRKLTPNLSFDEISKFIYDLNKIQDDKFPKTIELFGGEPFMRKDVIEIIELLKSYGYKILIATNGTLPILGDKKIHKYLINDVHIRISLDGHNKELHERYRTKNTFDTIVENIRKLRESNIDVSVKSIISDYNFPYIYDILTFLRDDLNVKHWNYNVLYKLEEYHKNKIETNINHYTMVKELCNDKYFEFLPMLKQTPLTQMLISVYVKNTQRYRRTYIFLNYDKKIYMNDQLIVPEYSVGNIGNLNDIKYQQFIDKYETRRQSCQGCFCNDYCYLGNYGELYNKDHTLMEEFPTCDILRNSIIFIMKQQNKGMAILKEIMR